MDRQRNKIEYQFLTKELTFKVKTVTLKVGPETRK